jgi:hypothetical protein
MCGARHNVDEAIARFSGRARQTRRGQGHDIRWRETAHGSSILRSDWSGEAFGLPDSLCPAWPFLLSHLSTPLYSCLHHHNPLRISLTGNLTRAVVLACATSNLQPSLRKKGTSDTLHQRDLARDDVRDAPNMRCDGIPFPLFLATPSYPRGMGAILRSGTQGSRSLGQPETAAVRPHRKASAPR